MNQRELSPNIDGRILLDAGQAIGLSRKRAEGQLTSLLRRLPQAANDQLHAMEAENVRLAERTALGPTLEGEARCVRVIVHGVIEEMVRRLAR